VLTYPQTLATKEKNLESLTLSLANTKSEIEEKTKLIDSKDKNLLATQETLKLRKSEIDKLNKMLLAANTQQDLLNNKIVLVQNILKDTKNEKETFKKQLRDYKGKVIVLSNQISDVNESIQLKDEKLLHLLNALDETETKYDGLIEKLQSQKAKIKSLTGIKLKVVAALKEELGDKVAIDKNSGSLRVSSNILFDKGSARLKEGAKVELKKVFEEYIGALVTNPKIKPHLDKIIIEGHTDSDGGYLYNLDLSQKRAFAVMNYLLSLDFAKEHHIQPLMIASGRAYLDAIKVDGVEDKDASRRIEIKFRLKNEDAMHEIEKVLDAE
jgi:chemotaxis protein MotB